MAYAGRFYFDIAAPAGMPSPRLPPLRRLQLRFRR